MAGRERKTTTEIVRRGLPALWKFERDDTSIEKPSWKYLDQRITGSEKNPVVTWIRNPNFAYEHLSPYGMDE